MSKIIIVATIHYGDTAQITLDDTRVCARHFIGLYLTLTGNPLPPQVATNMQLALFRDKVSSFTDHGMTVRLEK